jgi:hypothetical protein
MVFSASLSMARPTEPVTPPTMSDGFHPSLGDDDDNDANISDRSPSHALYIKLLGFFFWSVYLA